MKKISLELSEAQVEQLLDELPLPRKIEVVRRWEQETWPKRFRQLLAKIDRRLKQNPRLAKEARKAIGPARRAFYAGRHRH